MLLCHLYLFWPLSTYTPCQPQYTLTLPDTPNGTLMAPTSLKSPQWLFMPPIPLLASEYPHFLSVPNAPLTPLHPSGALPMAPTPLGALNAPLCHLLYLAQEYLHSLPAPQCTPNRPDGPSTPLHPLVSLLSLCNWPSAWVCNLQYPICSCQEYICSTVKLSQFLQYLPKHALQSSSYFTILDDQHSGLDMEIWLTPVRTSTYERPFTHEGNYLVGLLPPCMPVVFFAQGSYIVFEGHICCLHIYGNDIK